MLDKLRAFYTARTRVIQKKLNRTVPFGDTVVDRWEKAKQLGFGNNSSIYDSSLVLGDVRAGDNVWIGPGVVLDGSGAPLVIGSYCSISAGVQIYTHDSVGWAVTEGRQPYTQASTTIGSGVYIGPQTVISKGLNIGSHVIIGAQSFVNISLPDYAVAWGRPVKIVGTVVLVDDGSTYYIDFIKNRQ